MSAIVPALAALLAPGPAAMLAPGLATLLAPGPAAMLVAGLAAVLAALISARLASRAGDLSRRPAASPGLAAANGRPRRSRGTLEQLRGRLAKRRRWRRGITPDAVAVWCDALARRVRSGSTLREAARVEVPSDALLAELTEPLRLGIERGRPLSGLAQDLSADRVDGTSITGGGQHLVLAYSVIASASELGGSAAAPLDRVSAALRLRTADGQERTAHSAQARLSAHVLTVVPLAILGLLVTTDPDVRRVLASAAGTTALALGLTLNITGWWWMRHITGAGS